MLQISMEWLGSHIAGYWLPSQWSDPLYDPLYQRSSFYMKCVILPSQVSTPDKYSKQYPDCFNISNAVKLSSREHLYMVENNGKMTLSSTVAVTARDSV
uniref:Uncharacterized protein n=1 Tax=Timema shepardi TaxID=629360 RepID=A0A7R9FXZ5_TIMSH|nr:unnamed protein product [Timema shepardi]